MGPEAGAPPSPGAPSEGPLRPWGWSWGALVVLFAASLLTVSAWLLQLARRGRRRRRGGPPLWADGGDGAGRRAAPSSPSSPSSPPSSLASLLLGRLLAGVSSGGASGEEEEEEEERGSSGRAPSPSSAPGSLLASLFAFRAFREQGHRAWLRALNANALRLGSSIQITFEESPQQLPAVTVSQVVCTERSDRGMMFQCHISADAIQFPISVTQQSPAAVSMDSYQVTLTVLQAQLEIRLEEIQDEGLLVSWAFKDRPDLNLSVVPRLQLRDENDGKVDQSTIKDLIEDSVISTQPAMMVNLKACVTGGNLSSCNKLCPGSPSGSAAPMVPKLLLQNLRGRHLGSEETPGGRQLCCMVELDSPRQQKRTKPVPASSSGPAAEVEWPDKLVLDLGPQSKEVKLSILGSSGNNNGGSPGEEVLLGFTTIPLNSPSKDPRGQQVYSLKPGPFQKLPPAASVAVELLYQEPPELQPSSSLRTSITPTKKIEMDRTIMPDGTIVTTVTTIQSRPKADCKLDSPSRSPSKVEVTEKVTTMLPQNGCPISASPTSSRSSHVSNGLDPVAETAIRQLTDLTNRPAKKTPTKRSTLIISGVSKVPIAEDEMALSLGYAASLEGTLQDDSILAGMSEYTQSFTDPTQQQLEACYAAQDLDEATRSDISERASVDDVESETGSTGALETRSLKDHKVNFLRSGTKLIFRRKNKQKEAGLSQSHDDLPNASAASATRKKSGSFSRRLIKRFSFKTKSKPKANGSTMAADKH